MAKYELLKNVHQDLPLPFQKDQLSKIELVKGDYEYWHYICDGFDDRGFGCGYRTLQTICSWISSLKNISVVPSLPEIQNHLVELEDKEKSFIGSRDWIGSYEVCLVIDKLYDIPSKIVHVTSGNKLVNHVDSISNHFETFGSPIMMGGDQDASSKGIFGVAQERNGRSYFLIIDPHYYGSDLRSCEKLYQDSWVHWKPVDSFMDSSFYNLCLPQVRSVKKVGGAVSVQNKSAQP